MLDKLQQYRGSPPPCGWVAAIVRHEALHNAAERSRVVPLPDENLPAVDLPPDAAVYAVELRQPADGDHQRAAADVPGGGPAAGYRGPPERRGRPPAAHLEAATSEGGSVGREPPSGRALCVHRSVGIHGAGAGGRTHNGPRRGHRRVGDGATTGRATTARERRAAGFSNAAGGRRRHPRPTPSTWPPLRIQRAERCPISRWLAAKAGVHCSRAARAANFSANFWCRIGAFYGGF